MKEEGFFGDSPKLIGGLIGLFAGFFFFLSAIFLTLGICSNPAFAELLFPFTRNVDPDLSSRTDLELVIAAFQYPLYGFITGISLGYMSKWKDMDKFIKAIASILPSGFLHLFVFAVAKLFWSK